MKYPNRERLEMLRKKYPVGTKLRLVHITGTPIDQLDKRLELLRY